MTLGIYSGYAPVFLCRRSTETFSPCCKGFRALFHASTSNPLLQPLTPPTPLRFFPCIYDIKHLIHTFDDLHGGLGNIATQVLSPQPRAPSPSPHAVLSFTSRRTLLHLTPYSPSARVRTHPRPRAPSGQRQSAHIQRVLRR
jgi:hypothetical protein